MTLPRDDLVGLRFLTTSETAIRQGEIVSRVADVGYLVRYFSWESDRVLHGLHFAPVAKVYAWTFFETDQELRAACALDET